MFETYPFSERCELPRQAVSQERKVLSQGKKMEGIFRMVITKVPRRAAVLRPRE